MKTGEITVKVTREDIEAGVKCSAYENPVALAIKRCCEIGDYINLLVPGTHALIDDERVSIPDYIAKWLDDFDLGLPVQPLEFTITL